MKIQVKGNPSTMIKTSVKITQSSRSFIISAYFGLICLTLSLFSVQTQNHKCRNRNLIQIILFILGGSVIILGFLSEQVVKESFISIKNLGVQLESKKRNGKKTKVFVDSTKIRDLVINETLTPFQVKVNLALICDGHDLVIPFKQFSLTMEQLTQIYYPIREMIQKKNIN